MANLIVRMYADCFNFEYCGKLVTVSEMCKSDYILSKHDHTGFMAEMVSASYKFGDEWEAQYFPAVNAQIKILAEHSEFMPYWSNLKLVEVNQAGEIMQRFEHFDAGEDISTIWLWLESKFSTIKIADYL